MNKSIEPKGSNGYHSKESDKSNEQTDKALGIWTIELTGNKIFGLQSRTFELHPKMGDNKKFRRQVLFKQGNMKDRSIIFENTETFILDMIMREHKQLSEQEISQVKGLLETNIIPLFEKIMVDFGFSSEEELAKSKLDIETELKKKTIENV